MKARLFAIILSLLFLSGIRAEVIDRIIAKVDDGIITMYDVEVLRAKLPAFPDLLETYKKLETKEEQDLFILDILIDEMLIGKEIVKYSIQADEKSVMAAINDIAAQNSLSYEDFMSKVNEKGLNEVDYKDMIRSQIERMRFYARFVNSKVSVTEKEILTFFRESKDFFKDKIKVGFSLITFLKADDSEKASELSLSFLKKYKETSSITESAADLLDNKNVRLAKDISLKKKDMANDFKEAVEKLEPGEASYIIENDSSYNIIILKEIEMITLDSFKDRIEKKIRKDKQNKVYQSILSKLRQEHSIEKRY